mmetsp:Transcript_14369/g.29005  ORF Transcript_14369/g.29005 Transcript_14369/m.29005 type:complete len:228 (-) Transcript_14369:100-783(-)
MIRQFPEIQRLSISERFVTGYHSLCRGIEERKLGNQAFANSRGIGVVNCDLHAACIVRGFPGSISSGRDSGNLIGSFHIELGGFIIASQVEGSTAIGVNVTAVQKELDSRDIFPFGDSLDGKGGGHLRQWHRRAILENCGRRVRVREIHDLQSTNKSRALGTFGRRRGARVDNAHMRRGLNGSRRRRRVQNGTVRLHMAARVIQVVVNDRRRCRPSKESQQSELIHS